VFLFLLYINSCCKINMLHESDKTAAGMCLPFDAEQRQRIAIGCSQKRCMERMNGT